LYVLSGIIRKIYQRGSNYLASSDREKKKKDSKCW